ncbi:MAG: MMPL family transporter [Flavobacteriales bacterium]|nr:MMPL family transporter [Flavobacteriales bacterium]
MEEEKRYRRLAKWTLLGVILLSVFMGFRVSQLGFDYDFERFFPQNDPETDFFLAHRDKYSSENDFVLFSLENDGDIFEEEFLQEAKRFQDSLETLVHVESVQSLLNLEEIVQEPLFGSYYSRPYLRWDAPKHYQTDSVRIMESPNLINSFITEDGQAMAIMLEHTELLSKEKCDELAVAVDRILPHFSFDRLYKSGRAIGQGYFVERLQFELKLFVSASILLISLFLIIAFRSAWGVVVPLVVVLLSIIWLLGVMNLVGKDIDLLLTILPTILFVVGMSDVVHILSKYFDELRKGKSKIRSIKVSVKEVGLATFLTSITTAIGFTTLVGSSIIPIREFGLLSAAGVILAYILAFTILPATMVLTKVPPLREKRRGQDFWSRHLHRFYLWIIKHRRGIAWSSLALLVVCFIGMNRIQVNNFLLEDLKKDNPFRIEFDYFEKAYAGVRPFEMAVFVEDSNKSVLDGDVLHAMDRLDTYLREDYGAGFLISPLNFVKELNKADHNAKTEYYRLPSSDREIQKITRNLERSKRMGVMRQFLDEDLDEFRVAGKMGDWGKIEIDERNEALAEFWREEMPSYMDYKLTGTATLIDLNNEYLSTTMVWGLFVAFLIVALIVGIMYRSLKMVLIALIPNMLPLLMIAAIMGFTGIDLKVSTSIIFTIAFGIAVDDTIHFVSRMRLELAKGRSRQYALKRSFIGTGKAIIITSLILVAGFLTLIISTFKGTFYTGLLLSLTLFFAVLVDLLLLPVLFWMFYPKEKVQTVDGLHSE